MNIRITFQGAQNTLKHTMNKHIARTHLRQLINRIRLWRNKQDIQNLATHWKAYRSLA